MSGPGQPVAGDANEFGRMLGLPVDGAQPTVACPFCHQELPEEKRLLVQLWETLMAAIRT